MDSHFSSSEKGGRLDLRLVDWSSGEGGGGGKGKSEGYASSIISSILATVGLIGEKGEEGGGIKGKAVARKAGRKRSMEEERERDSLPLFFHQLAKGEEKGGEKSLKRRPRRCGRGKGEKRGKK